MTVRQRVENIIIGTLLESAGADNYYDECTMLTPDMFLDDTNRRVFALVSDMNRNGKTATTLYDVYAEYGDAVADIVPRMAELVCDFSFIHLKTEYNEKRYLANINSPVEYRPTEVKFSTYVNKLIQIHFKDEARTTEIRQSACA
jgi:hypothetical protein